MPYAAIPSQVAMLGASSLWFRRSAPRGRVAHQSDSGAGKSLPVGKLDVYKKYGAEKGKIGDLEDNVISRCRCFSQLQEAEEQRLRLEPGLDLGRLHGCGVPDPRSCGDCQSLAGGEGVGESGSS